MRRIEKLLAVPLYPLLIGIYAVLFLWSVNIGQLIPASVARSLSGALVICLVVLGGCWAIWRNFRKAALFSGWLLVVFFSYGHVYRLVEDVSIAGVMVGRHRFLLAAFGLLTLLLLVLLIRARGNLRDLTKLLNVVMLVMVALAAIPIIGYEVRYGDHIYQAKKDGSAAQAAAAESAPDVYYIILDGYSEAGVMAELYGYDNQDFLAALKAMGFYIPECAYSNYAHTTPSLSSSLNMEYLDAMGFSEKAASNAFDPTLAPLVTQSKVRQEFERMGYRTAAFRGYMPALDLRDADYYFNLEMQEGKFNQTSARNFEHMLLATTLLRPLMEAFEGGGQNLPDALTDPLYVKGDSGQYLRSAVQWREESEFSFKMLAGIPRLPGKKFVYGHFYSTHKPFVFDADGSFLPPEMHEVERLGYIPTVKYTNQRLLPILKRLIEDSGVKPVIILQGDHGTVPAVGADHNKILNAYYFPDQDYSRLYGTITPVNTFRVVFNQFFAQNYPLLPDNLLVRDLYSENDFTVRYMAAACGLK